MTHHLSPEPDVIRGPVLKFIDRPFGYTGDRFKAPRPEASVSRDPAGKFTSLRPVMLERLRGFVRGAG